MKKMFLSVMLFSSILLAQNSKVKIFVADLTEDRVGQSLIYKFKEEIRKSSIFELINDLPSYPCYYILFQTMDKNKDEANMEGLSTIYNIIWGIYYPNDDDGLTLHYIRSRLGFVGQKQIDDCSLNLMANTDKYFKY